jgi:hypothetical protein
LLLGGELFCEQVIALSEREVPNCESTNLIHCIPVIVWARVAEWGIGRLSCDSQCTNIGQTKAPKCKVQTHSSTRYSVPDFIGPRDNQLYPPALLIHALLYGLVSHVMIS